MGDEKNKRPRVILADDHREVVAGVRTLLEPHFEVVAVAEDGRSLLEMAETLKPDLLIVDVSMPVLSGIEAVEQLKKQDPQARVLFLSMHHDPAMLRRALAVGGSGYVLKVSAPTELVPAVWEILRGRRYVCASLQDELQSGL